jgi:hypothetical protein
VKRVFTVGDPQAPAATFFAILDRYDLRSADGWLEPDVHLVSIGDHFDYGSVEDRRSSSQNGTEILSWLAAHPPEQVTILIGNHDFARICELAPFDDDSFQRAREEADLIYDAETGRSDPELEAAFIQRYPSLPTAEIVARDYASFTVEQRSIVERLISSRRMRLAHATERRRLFTHAGVTLENLESIGVTGRDRSDAFAVAHALNAHLDRAIAEQRGGNVDLFPLHQPGSARYGEGRGILYHRPSHPACSKPELFEGPPGRRFDPRRIPLGLVQVIGHIRDGKCRSLLGDWAERQAPRDGPLRHLMTDGADARYAFGVPELEASDRGVLIFTDGAMSKAPIDEYELLGPPTTCS